MLRAAVELMQSAFVTLSRKKGRTEQEERRISFHVFHLNEPNITRDFMRRKGSVGTGMPAYGFVHTCDTLKHFRVESPASLQRSSALGHVN